MYGSRIWSKVCANGKNKVYQRSCTAMQTQSSIKWFSTLQDLEKCSIRQAKTMSEGSNVSIHGWVKTVRKHKAVSFVSVNDGSCLEDMQISIANNDNNLETSPSINVDQLTVGSSVSVAGTLQAIPAKPNSQNSTTQLELCPTNMTLVGPCDVSSYPLQKKYQSLEFLRTQMHLRPRTNTFGAVSRVRNALSFGLHSYFQSNDFLQIHTPILTSTDAEGAGEQFQVTTTDGKSTFFGPDSPTFLTVSGQLHAEMFACSLSKVYTFGPTFRAENSNTTRHLSEFWMVEPEMAYASLDDCMICAQDAIQYTLRHLLTTCEKDIKFFTDRYDKTLIGRLEKLAELPEFHRITYTKAIEILKEANPKIPFENNSIEWGMDLMKEHENYLALEYFGGPVFVTNYPLSLKPFYMRRDSINNVESKEGRQTVAAMDLLVPGIGELIGGSVREDRFEILEQQMEKKLGEKKEGLKWYLELRKFGSVPHAGWGLGFERFVLLVTGMGNIRDVIPLPRTPYSCPY